MDGVGLLEGGSIIALDLLPSNKPEDERRLVDTHTAEDVETALWRAVNDVVLFNEAVAIFRSYMVCGLRNSSELNAWRAAKKPFPPMAYVAVDWGNEFYVDSEKYFAKLEEETRGIKVGVVDYAREISFIEKHIPELVADGEKWLDAKPVASDSETARRIRRLKRKFGELKNFTSSWLADLRLPTEFDILGPGCNGATP